MSRRVRSLPGVMPMQRIPTARRRIGRGVWMWLVVIFLGSAGYWALFVGPTFRIQSIELTGASHPSLDAVVANLRGQNIFRVNEANIEQTLRQAYSPVASVSLVRGLPRTVRLAVTLRSPALRWKSRDQVYLVDEQGIVFEQSDKEAYYALPLVTDLSGVPVTIGQQIVTNDFTTFMQTVTTQSTAVMGRSYKVSEIAETSFHVDVLLDGDLRIRLTTQRPLDEQLRGARLILDKHPEAKYIDVRVPGWGYWKP